MICWNTALLTSFEMFFLIERGQQEVKHEHVPWERLALHKRADEVECGLAMTFPSFSWTTSFTPVTNTLLKLGGGATGIPIYHLKISPKTLTRANLQCKYM